MLQRALLVCVLAVAGCAWLSDAAAPANVMAMGAQYPEVSRVLSIIGMNDPSLKAYLSNPNTVCTFFAATNKAMENSMVRLGKYVGLASQNETMQSATFNYQVIPGKALTSADLMKINDTMTRANETLYISHQGGKPLIYSRPDYPVALEKANIKAGKCLVHIIGMTVVPPSSILAVQAWLDELQTMPPPPPRADWGEIRTPQQAELAAASEQVLARLAGNATAAAAPGADVAGEVPAAAPAQAPKAASSAMGLAANAAMAAVGAAVAAALL